MAQMNVTKTRPAYQAYQLLYLGFIVAPLVAGLDKFTHFLTDWDKYLAPSSLVSCRSPPTRSCSWSRLWKSERQYWWPSVRTLAPMSWRRG